MVSPLDANEIGGEVCFIPVIQPDKIRWCVHSVELNKLINSGSSENIPTIPQLYDQLSKRKFKYLTQLDVKDAYFSLRWLMATNENVYFKWNDIRYKFDRVQFGLVDAPIKFNNMMKQILGQFEFVVYYFDNILVLSNSYEEHVEHVKKVIEVLNQFNLPIKKEKSQFLCTTVPFLGFTLSTEGVAISPEKAQDIFKIITPNTVKRLQSFIGFANFNRQFIPKIAEILRPLYAVLVDVKRGKIPISRMLHVELVCNYIKKRLNYAVKLSFPPKEGDYQLAIFADASKYAIGGMLAYIQDDRVVPMGFFSRQFKDYELEYTTTKKELAAVVHGVRKFKSYIVGREVQIFTDHQSLVYNAGEKKDMNRSETEWWAELGNYNLTFSHIPGEQNIVADILSRLTVDEEELDDELCVAAWASAQFRTPLDESELKRLQSYNDQQQAHYIKKLHMVDHCHPGGISSQLKALGVTWDKIDEKCINTCKTCETCIVYNPAHAVYDRFKSISALNPMELVQFDLAGPLPRTTDGYRFILVYLDVFTNFITLTPLKNKDSTTIEDALFKNFCAYGIPQKVQSDNAAEFTAQNITKLLSNLKIQHNLSSEYNPRSNGRVERKVGVMKQLIQKLMYDDHEKDKSWFKYVSKVQLLINTRKSDITGYSPFFTLFGYEHKGIKGNDLIDFETIELLPWFAKQSIKQQAHDEIREVQNIHSAKMIERMNQKHRTATNQLPINSIVWLTVEQRTFGQPHYSGPFRVYDYTPEGSYILSDAASGVVLHRSAVRDQLKVTEIGDGIKRVALVEEIVQRRLGQRTRGNRKRIYKYKIKWLNVDGYKWVQEHDLSPDLVEAYRVKSGGKNSFKLVTDLTGLI